MRFLLDTNAVSEWAKPQPDPGVMQWLYEADEDSLFLSVITLAELHFGVERLPAGARRNRLSAWIREELVGRFTGRILAVDEAVAGMWGQLLASSEGQGRHVNLMDCFLAATAKVHGLALVTRNQQEFAAALGTVVNPWSGE
jgi:toxin FitB